MRGPDGGRGMTDVNSDRAFAHGGAVLSVAFSPDGKWLAAGDYAKKPIKGDADTGAEKHAFEHGGLVFSVAFSPDGKWSPPAIMRGS